MKIAVAFLLVTVAFAGCAGEEAPAPTGGAGSVDPDGPSAGKGAINGLLVDDAFRPLELTDETTGEYQRKGFILLQETGQQVQSDADGAFSFNDLDPGEYTLRATVEGHEGTPKRVTLVEGEITEIILTMRRESSETSLIFTEEYSVFIPCAVGVIVNAITFGCLDSSGDSYRTGPAGLNYTKYADATYMIAEALMTEEALFSLVVRGADGRYADASSDGGNYMKAIMQNGAIYDAEMNTDPWIPGAGLEAQLFFSGVVENPATPACPVLTTIDDAVPINSPTCIADLGPAVGQKGRVMLSVFIGEPNVDLENYRLLTETAS